MSFIDYLPNDKFEIALNICKTFKNLGFESYFVGGSVRDPLCKIVSNDIDIATNCSVKFIKETFNKNIVSFNKFGVFKIKINDKFFEISIFRKDGVYINGRHPEDVASASLAEDANRRDFTINSIYFDPILHEFKDFLGGLNDIEKKLIRAIGIPSKRFSEDRLRIIRAIRFCSTLNFNIENNTYNAMVNVQDKLKGISIDRLILELNRCLMGNKPSIALNLLFELNVLNLFFPELIKLKYLDNDILDNGDTIWNSVMNMIDNTEYKDLTLVWSILFLFLENEYDIKHILKRLRFTKKQVENIYYICVNHKKLLQAKILNKIELKELVSKNLFLQQLKLLDIYLKEFNLGDDSYNYLKNLYKDFDKEFPRPIVDGKFLLKFGLIPNNKFSEIILSTYKAQLEGKVKDTREAKTFLEHLIWNS